MTYQAIARYCDNTYRGAVSSADDAAVQSVLSQLPRDRDSGNVVLIVQSAGDVSYVTTEAKYNSDTN